VRLGRGNGGLTDPFSSGLASATRLFLEFRADESSEEQGAASGVSISRGRRDSDLIVFDVSGSRS
jgi:hypothetical protein